MSAVIHISLKTAAALCDAVRPLGPPGSGRDRSTDGVRGEYSAIPRDAALVVWNTPAAGGDQLSDETGVVHKAGRMTMRGNPGMLTSFNSGLSGIIAGQKGKRWNPAFVGMGTREPEARKVMFIDRTTACARDTGQGLDEGRGCGPVRTVKRDVPYRLGAAKPSHGRAGVFATRWDPPRAA
jgi:hypothetical protein